VLTVRAAGPEFAEDVKQQRETDADYYNDSDDCADCQHHVKYVVHYDSIRDEQVTCSCVIQSQF